MVEDSIQGFEGYLSLGEYPITGFIGSRIEIMAWVLVLDMKYSKTNIVHQKCYNVLGQKKEIKWKLCLILIYTFFLGVYDDDDNFNIFYLLVEMGLPLHLFPAYMWWELDQLFLKRNHYKFWNELNRVWAHLRHVYRQLWAPYSIQKWKLTQNWLI